MSKQSLIGLVLMFLVLLGFSYWQTSKMEKQRAANTTSQSPNRESEGSGMENTAAFQAGQTGESLPTGGNETRQHRFDSTHPFSAAAQGEARHFRVENEVFSLDINTKGGRISGINLKEYLTYQKDSLILFAAGEGRYMDILDPGATAAYQSERTSTPSLPTMSM